MHRQARQGLAAIVDYDCTLQTTIEEEDEKQVEDGELADGNKGVDGVKQKRG